MTARFRYLPLMAVSNWIAQKSFGSKRTSTARPLSPASKPSFAFVPGQRELRLDLFRGLALWFVYFDHVSPDVLTWLTIRSYGFSDATEIFIFISGYTAGLVYGRANFELGIVVGTMRVLRRVWQIYTAHLLLFVVLIAEIAYATTMSQKPSFYIQEMEVGEFFRQPGAEMVQVLLLRFRPLNMDVLPLYIVLMAVLPLILQLARGHRDLPLVLSVILYVIVLRYDLNLSTDPEGFWSFNPCAWQLLFVFGVWCALGGGQRLSPMLESSVIFWIAVGYLCAAFFVTLTWHVPSLESLIPGWLLRAIYPIDKTNFDVLRFTHFLALTIVTLRFVPSGWARLRSPYVRPLILCGQYSLQIFTLGVALSFAGYALLMEFDAGVVLHCTAGVAGILILCAVARTFTWYRWAISGRGRETADPSKPRAHGS
jgi:hypothetical protein